MDFTVDARNEEEAISKIMSDFVISRELIDTAVEGMEKTLERMVK